MRNEELGMKSEELDGRDSRRGAEEQRARREEMSAWAGVARNEWGMRN